MDLIFGWVLAIGAFCIAVTGIVMALGRAPAKTLWKLLHVMMLFMMVFGVVFVIWIEDSRNSFSKYLTLGILGFSFASFYGGWLYAAIRRRLKPDIISGEKRIP